MKQKTLKKDIRFEGKGLHTGQSVSLHVFPADSDHGITFSRSDVDAGLKVRAVVKNCCMDAMRQTALMVGGAQIKTIEHLMAAFHGLGIDNAHVDVTAEELPAMDGSAREYVEAFLKIGLREQDAERKVIKITQPIYVDRGDQSIVILPANQFNVSYTLNYNHEDLQDQYLSLTILPENFERGIAPARTFCLKDEAHALLAQGFGKGANVSNTLVFENNAPVDNTLRFSDEACRHKVLDLLGDLFLAGRFIEGHVIANRSGHALNLEFVKELLMKQGDESKEMEANEKSSWNIHDIQRVLPHRYPFLFVDRIEEFRPGKGAIGYKQVTINDNFFQGHFPGHPVMPGVLIIEAMAQVGGVIMLSRKENRNKIAYFMSIDSAKFRQPVMPGDELKMVVEVKKMRARTGQCAGHAYVGDKLVCEAEVKFAIVDK